MKIGNECVWNEDIISLWALKPGADVSRIKAGTKGEIIELDGEFVTVKFSTGQKVRTETHMINVIE